MSRPRRARRLRFLHARHLENWTLLEERVMASETLAMLGFGTVDLSVLRSIDYLLGASSAWERPQIAVTAGSDDRSSTSASVRAGSRPATTLDWPTLQASPLIVSPGPNSVIPRPDLPRPQSGPDALPSLPGTDPNESNGPSIAEAPKSNPSGGLTGSTHGGGGAMAATSPPAAASAPADAADSPPPIVPASSPTGSSGTPGSSAGLGQTRSSLHIPSTPVAGSDSTQGEFDPPSASPSLSRPPILTTP